METYQPIAGVDLTIAQAREQLLLLILKTEMERASASRLDGLQIRTSSFMTGMKGTGRREQQKDDLAVASSQ
jgi:hypothetical protein